MRVFVTGASGFVGSAVVKELVDAGYEVLGLVRSDAGANSVKALGAEVHRGDLEDLESLKTGAEGADGVIHTAFVHDFSRFQEVCEIDRRAIEAIGSALAGSDRPLIVTSGMAFLRQSGLAQEDDVVSRDFPRKSEAAADELAARGIRASVVRLPPSVHGEGDHGFIPMLADVARAKGAAAYVGEGLNVWAGVHRLDAARLYRLVLEKGVASGRYHGVGDEGVPFREIAGVLGRHLKVPVVSKTQAEAQEHFGWFAMFTAADIGASAQRTRESLGWAPTQTGLLADIDRASYYESGTAASTTA